MRSKIHLSALYLFFLLINPVNLVLAHTADGGEGGIAQKHDWEARIPLLILVTVFVIGVNAAFIVPTLEKLRKEAAATPDQGE